MSYRDDLQAARMRRDALAREVRELRGRMNEYQELERKAGTLERELDQCGRDLDQARRQVALPLLQKVRVASPCKERWDDMTGDDHVRFCGRCEKNVYDLSSLTAEQAESLLRERGESMCVRFFRRSDGTVLTSDCPVGQRKRLWRKVTAGAVAAAGLAMVAIGYQEQVMGGIEAPTMGEMAVVDVQEVAGGLEPMPAVDFADPPPAVDFADPPPPDTTNDGATPEPVEEMGKPVVRMGRPIVR